MGSAQLLILSERRAMKETMFIAHTVPGNLRRQSFGTEAAFCWEKKLMISRFSQLKHNQTSTTPGEKQSNKFH